jgi:hypothetical protein
LLNFRGGRRFFLTSWLIVGMGGSIRRQNGSKLPSSL